MEFEAGDLEMYESLKDWAQQKLFCWQIRRQQVSKNGDELVEKKREKFSKRSKVGSIVYLSKFLKCLLKPKKFLVKTVEQDLLIMI